MGSNENTKQMGAESSPSLDTLINVIDRQLDRVPRPHTAQGFEDYWASQIGEYKKPDEQFIRFVLNDHICAIPLQKAVEIDYLPDVTPLPNLPQWILGICNLRGDLVSVVDIKQILQLKSDGAGAVKKMILIRHEDISTVIIVDKILGMLFADEHPLQSGNELKVNQAFSKFVRSTIAMDRQTVHLLDVGRLMKALELKP